MAAAGGELRGQAPGQVEAGDGERGGVGEGEALRDAWGARFVAQGELQAVVGVTDDALQVGGGGLALAGLVLAESGLGDAELFGQGALAQVRAALPGPGDQPGCLDRGRRIRVTCHGHAPNS